MNFSVNSALNALGTAAIATALTTVVASAAPSAQAATFNFGFQNITLGDSTAGDAIVGQFSFSVTDFAPGKTLWQFTNAGSVDSFVSGIYFDWKGLSSDPITSIFALNATGTSSGVNYVPSSGKLPQGQNVRVLGNNLGFDNSPGNLDADLVLAPKSPGSNKDGIDPGETLGVIFNSVGAETLKSLILADTLRIGIRVQGIAPNGGSDAFLDGDLIPPPPVRPVPVPGLFLGVALAGGFGVSRVIKGKKPVA